MKIKSKFITRTSLMALQIALGMTTAHASKYGAFEEFLKRQEGISSESARHLTQQPTKVSPQVLKEKVTVLKEAEIEGDVIRQELIQRSQIEPHRPTREIFEEVRGGGARAILQRLILDENDVDLIASARHLLALGEDAGAITGDQIDAMLAFRIGGRVDPTLEDVNGWADNDDVHRPRRILVAAVGLDSTDADLRRGARLCNAVLIANPSAEQIRAAVAFRAGGHNNPTQAEINGWANNNDANRPYRVILAGHGLDSTDAGLLTATGKCVTAGIVAPTPDQIDGADAFIQGGHNNPTQGQINAWVLDGNAQTKEARVVAVHAGIVNPDADQLEGTRAYLDGHVLAPTQQQIIDWTNDLDYATSDARIIAVHAGIAAPNGNQLDAVKAFVAAGIAAPTQGQINDWVTDGDIPTKAARVVAVHAGIAAPNGNQLDAVKAFIARGVAAPTQGQINAWVADGDVDNKAAIVVAVLFGVANPVQQDIDNITHGMVKLGYGNGITQDQYDAIDAFTYYPTATQVAKWISDVGDRAEIVEAVDAFNKKKVKDASDREIDDWIAAPARGRTNVKTKAKVVKEAVDRRRL
jgi:hypothetical protein